jgi:hypothetical protein
MRVSFSLFGTVLPMKKFSSVPRFLLDLTRTVGVGEGKFDFGGTPINE